MQTVPLFVSALAGYATVARAQHTAPCLLSPAQASGLLDVPVHAFDKLLGRTPSQDRHHVLAERAVAGYSALGTRYNKCVDVSDGNFANGAVPQLWDCLGNGNQQWKISGNNLRTINGLCLDVPSGVVYPGAPLQLWACDANNRNQWFEVAGNSIRKKNTNYCLDVQDGHYSNGGKLQIWPCDWNFSGGNQVFSFAGATSVADAANPSNFLGYPTVSWDRFAQLHSECAPYGDAFKAAAAATGLVPTLIAAIAETESSCNPNVNEFGMMQFTDSGAWQKYGDGGDKTKASDAIWAGARYIRDLLNENSQNLDNALRAYNGPISQGGNPGYTQEIRTWMSGGNPWG